jgi:hypothetical protein
MPVRPHLAQNLLFTLLALPCLAQGKLEVTPRTIDLGTLDATKGTTPFNITLRNGGDGELNLGWVEASCSCVAGDPDAGILAPGASTTLRATFNPTGFSGTYNGQLDIHADGLAPLVSITLQAQIRPDVEPAAPPATYAFPAVHHGQDRLYAPETVFKTRSEVRIDPALVTIRAESPYLGAKATFKEGVLLVTPYLESSHLPTAGAGSSSITVIFRGAALTTYKLPIEWHRANPVQVTPLPRGAYRIVFEDCPVRVKAVKAPFGTRFTTDRSRDGHTITISPVLRQTNTKRALRILKPGESLLLITNHPTRPQISIACEDKERPQSPMIK